jgi:hypothetical protein
MGSVPPFKSARLDVPQQAQDGSPLLQSMIGGRRVVACWAAGRRGAGRKRFDLFVEPNGTVGEVVETADDRPESLLSRIMRLWLTSVRWEVFSADALVMTIERPWSWFSHRSYAYDPQGAYLGCVRQHNNNTGRPLIAVIGSDDRLAMTIWGPLLGMWNLDAQRPDGTVAGVIERLNVDVEAVAIQGSLEGDVSSARLLLASALCVVVTFSDAPVDPYMSPTREIGPGAGEP